MDDAPARRRLAPFTAHGGPEPTGERVAADGYLLARAFERADISELRHAVTDCAGATGLTGRPLEDFVLAINELVTNAVRHGGGGGLLRLWLDDGDLVCEVSDGGGGIAGRAGEGRHKPALSVGGGWGLWLARQLSDTMAVTTGEAGTVVRVSMSLRDGSAGIAPLD